MMMTACARVNDADVSQIEKFRFADEEERQAFGPAQHIRAVHPSNKQGTGLRRGHVVFARSVRGCNDRHWEQWSVDIDHASEAARKLIEGGKHQTADDLYFSMQCFFRGDGDRTANNLARIGCAYVDIDYETRAKWKGQEPRVVAQAVLDRLNERKIALPSFIIHSGKGLHCVWSHELLPRAAVKRWDLVQDHLVEALKEFGADRKARDVSRVLRLAGSWNVNASRGDPTRGIVRLLWIQGAVSARPDRYTFDMVADSVLPHTRAEIVSLRAERAKLRGTGKCKIRKGQKLATRRNAGSYAETVLEDLHRLRVHRYRNGRLPPGSRDAWLFIASMALAWITPADALESVIVQLAGDVVGWKAREARSSMGAIIRRARDAAAGKKIEFRGKECDPRYLMGVATMCEWLEVSADEMRKAGLRLLLDPEARRDRNVAACRERRQKEGAVSHDDRLAQRREIGQRAMWLHIKDGWTYAEIASEFGISRATVGKAIADARNAEEFTRKCPVKPDPQPVKNRQIRAVQISVASAPRQRDDRCYGSRSALSGKDDSVNRSMPGRGGATASAAIETITPSTLIDRSVPQGSSKAPSPFIRPAFLADRRAISTISPVTSERKKRKRA